MSRPSFSAAASSPAPSPSPCPSPRPARDAQGRALRALATAAAGGFAAVPVGHVSRQMPAHVAHYLAHTTLGLAIARLSRLSGRDRATIRHACRRIEALRDDARADLALDSLDRGLVLFARALHVGRPA